RNTWSSRVRCSVQAPAKLQVLSVASAEAEIRVPSEPKAIFRIGWAGAVPAAEWPNAMIPQPADVAPIFTPPVPSAVAIRSPRGENATLWTGPAWPARVCRTLPSAHASTRAVLSADPARIIVPAGLTASERIAELGLMVSDFCGEPSRAF